MRLLASGRDEGRVHTSPPIIGAGVRPAAPPLASEIVPSEQQHDYSKLLQVGIPGVSKIASGSEDFGADGLFSGAPAQYICAVLLSSMNPARAGCAGTNRGPANAAGCAPRKYAPTINASANTAAIPMEVS